jgi:hypothetical protein
VASKESVWSKLNSVTVEKEKKGKFDYISWTDMWQEINTHYPDIQYEFKTFDHPTHGVMDCMVYPDGTASVHSTVTIEGLTHSMWLAVTDHNNQAKKNWGVVDIANTKMRCLTKNISMFGLGSHVYRGEDIADRVEPKAQAKPKPTPKKQEAVSVEDVPQEEPLLFEGEPFEPKFFVTKFLDTLKEFPVETKSQLDDMYKKHSQQFKLVQSHAPKLYEDTVEFFKSLKEQLPESTTEGEKNDGK